MTRARSVRRLARTLLPVLSLAAVPAWADRTSHLFLDETQVLPEGDVELEQWVWAQGQIPSQAGRYVSDWVWTAPVVGISSHLELSLPLVLVATSDQTVLNSLSLVARYRLFPREQDDGFQPLLRVEYQQPISGYTLGSGDWNFAYPNPPELKVAVVTTYGNLTGVRLTANVGVQLGLPFLVHPVYGNVSVLGAAGVGVSVPVSHEFRLAAEFDGQVLLTKWSNPYPPTASGWNYYAPNPYPGQLFLGPSVAWTRGQIWVTFGSLFGLTNNSNRFLPKVLWGITF